MSAAALSGPVPALGDILKSKIKFDVEDKSMDVWDKGVLLNELQRQDLVLKVDDQGAANGGLVSKRKLKKGTFKGTQLAMKEIYKMAGEA